MEASEREMRKGLEQARDEMESWKSKYTTALKEHANTMGHMQRELESLRASEKTLRTQLRDMELDNDDLEKSEREKDSSLQDFEARYGKSLERIALLEEELVNKAQLEEEAQRLRDELRDVNEEITIMKTQTTSFAHSHPRPMTPPGPNPVARRSSVTPSPPPSPPGSTPDEFQTTPKARSNSSTTLEAPIIAFTDATPLRPGSSPQKLTAALPPPAAPQIIRASVTPLARSTKTANLSSVATSTPPLRASVAATKPASTSSRLRRGNNTISEMKEMTERVKQLTQRLDSRRNLVMAGSSIPRATPPRDRLSMSTRPSTSSGDGNVAVASTRPPSRSALRMSIGGQARTGIPVRPPSRLSVSTSRSTTPTPSSKRSPTPSSAASITGRAPWGSSLPSSTGGSTAIGTPSRRRTSSVFASSTSSAVPPPLPKTSAELLATRRSTDLSMTIGVSGISGGRRSADILRDGQAALGVGRSLPSAANGQPANGREGIARRASLALGRSVLRRPSGS
ncbi:hypothetical protein T439DRAFT_209997 [Meredithblackwellia eburnea MCA 4105]